MAFVRLPIISALVLILALTALSAVTLAQQPQPQPFTDSRELPDRPAVKRGQELIEAVKNGDAQRLRAFAQEAFAPSFLEQIPLEEHVQVLSEVAESARHLKLYGLRNYDPPHAETEAVLILHNELTEGWEAVVVEVEPQAPHRITGAAFRPARPPADVKPPQAATEAETVQQIAQFVRKLADAGEFSGAVLIANGDQVLHEQAFGEADLGHHVANNLDTKFNLGSMNKMFTAVAVGQLVEQGKLSFEDPIGKYLDESWLPRDITDKVLVKHLLTHSSGLGSYFNKQFMDSSRLRYREVDDYKPLVNSETLAFEPGTSQAYSNTGFLLLGAIIEKASGENYFDYVRKHIYEPAGMTNSDSYELDTVVENLAIGYHRQGGELKNNTFLHVVRGGPAGGGYSTVRDLHRFAEAMRKDKLVSAEMRQTLWTVKPEAKSMTYGYGFGVNEVAGQQIVGHGGGFPGISSDLSIFVDNGYTIAVMSNRGAAQPVVERARTLLATVRESE